VPASESIFSSTKKINFNGRKDSIEVDQTGWLPEQAGEVPLTNNKRSNDMTQTTNGRIPQKLAKLDEELEHVGQLEDVAGYQEGKLAVRLATLAELAKLEELAELEPEQRARLAELAELAKLADLAEPEKRAALAEELEVRWAEEGALLAEYEEWKLEVKAKIEAELAKLEPEQREELAKVKLEVEAKLKEELGLRNNELQRERLNVNNDS